MQFQCIPNIGGTRGAGVAMAPQNFQKAPYSLGKFYAFVQMSSFSLPRNFFLHNGPEENFLAPPLFAKINHRCCFYCQTKVSSEGSITISSVWISNRYKRNLSTKLSLTGTVIAGNPRRFAACINRKR